MLPLLSPRAPPVGAPRLAATLGHGAEPTSSWKPDASDVTGNKDPLAYWTHWRGPSHQGYVADDKVLLKWSETENVAWKTKLPGGGNSSPIVYGDRVFLTASNGKGSELYVLCVRATDGKSLWQQTAGKDVAAAKSQQWNGYASPSRATG